MAALARIGCWRLTSDIRVVLEQALQGELDFEIVDGEPNAVDDIDFWILGATDSWADIEQDVGYLLEQNTRVGMALVNGVGDSTPLRGHWPQRVCLWEQPLDSALIRREVVAFLISRGSRGGEAVDEVISMWLHDLNSPLCVLQSSLSFLSQDMADEKDMRELVPEGLDAMRRIDAMVKNLRYWCRGLEGLEGSFLDFGEVVVRGLDVVQFAVGMQRLHLEVDVEKGVRVRAKLNALEVLVTNALNNALEHAPTGSTIRVQLHTKGA